MKKTSLITLAAILILAAVFVLGQIFKEKPKNPIADTGIKSGKVRGATDPKISQPKPLPLAIKISRKKVYLWWQQKLTIKTQPGAEVRIEVTYPSGSKNNDGTRTAMADSKGLVEFQWSIKGYNNYGRAKVEVAVSNGTRSAIGKTEFEIIEAGSR